MTLDEDGLLDLDLAVEDSSELNEEDNDDLE